MRRAKRARAVGLCRARTPGAHRDPKGSTAGQRAGAPTARCVAKSSCKQGCDLCVAAPSQSKTVCRAISFCEWKEPKPTPRRLASAKEGARRSRQHQKATPAAVAGQSAAAVAPHKARRRRDRKARALPGAGQGGAVTQGRQRWPCFQKRRRVTWRQCGKRWSRGCL